METDFVIAAGPSVFLVIPITEEAHAWLKEISEYIEDAQFLGNNLAVEHRYILSFIDTIKEAGHTVGRGY